ncbi:MAG: RNA polymerase sigma factor [Candidatus Acidiferrales bacterium]
MQSSQEPFERIMEEYQGRVFRLACSILRNEAAAEDAAQEVFIKVWKALPKFQGQSSLGTWIYAISRNTCLTRLKRERIRETLPLEEAKAAVMPSPQGDPAGEREIRALVDRLPEKYRRVLVMFYFEERSYGQVAEALDMPMGTVKTFLHRAKKELASLLGAAGQEKLLSGEEKVQWPAINSKI